MRNSFMPDSSNIPPHILPGKSSCSAAAAWISCSQRGTERSETPLRGVFKTKICEVTVYALLSPRLPAPTARARPALSPWLGGSPGTWTTGLQSSTLLLLPDGSTRGNKCVPKNSAFLCGFEQPCVTHTPAESDFRYSWLLWVKRAITSSQNRLSR